MDALLVRDIPTGPGWQYEPKWDGFRCLAFRDGATVKLQSKAGRPLTRYFPELEAAVRGLKAKRFVLDGEIVTPSGRTLSFEQLLMRIHPAASRIAKLASEAPAQMVVFDLLRDTKGISLLHLPLKERRRLLVKFSSSLLSGNKYFRLSPATANLKMARKWFASAGNRFDGVVAKRLDAEYRPGERTAMQKIKPRHTADCVVGGFRYAAKGSYVGSLLLGLYDAQGLLHHVGFCSGLRVAERSALTRRLQKLIKPPGFTGHAPGGPSRWTNTRPAEWQPLRPQLVVEVEFDHVTGKRFRHGTKFLRWRIDKKPAQCGLSQIWHQAEPPDPA